MPEQSINLVELDKAVSTLNSLPLSSELKAAVNGVRELSPSTTFNKSYDYTPRRPTQEDVDTKIRALELSLKSIEPQYEQPVFKCLGDFKLCCEDNHKATCVTLLIICIANQFVSIKADIKIGGDSDEEGGE